MKARPWAAIMNIAIARRIRRYTSHRTRCFSSLSGIASYPDWNAFQKRPVAPEHAPCVGLRRQLAQMLRERRRRDLSRRGRAGLFPRLRHLDRLTDRSTARNQLASSEITDLTAIG